MLRTFDTKDPDEVDFWNIDFADMMPPTDSIATLGTVFVTGSDTALVIDQTSFSGKVVSGRWQAGTLDVTYTITARVTTTQGRTLDKSGVVFIAEN
jgi:hypothetical protein